MTRLFDLGLAVLLVSTLAGPAANAEPQPTSQPQTTQSQPTQPQISQPQPTQPRVGDVRLQPNQTETAQEQETQLLSERDRLILERQTQRLIPHQE